MSIWHLVRGRIKKSTACIQGHFFSLYPHFSAPCRLSVPKQVSLPADLSTRPWGINLTNFEVIPQSLVMRSIVLGWILIYPNWSIIKDLLLFNLFLYNVLVLPVLDQVIKKSIADLVIRKCVILWICDVSSGKLWLVCCPSTTLFLQICNFRAHFENLKIHIKDSPLNYDVQYYCFSENLHIRQNLN